MILLVGFVLCDTPTQYNTGKAALIMISCEEKRILPAMCLIVCKLFVVSFIFLIFNVMPIETNRNA
jgi:hypothetical protein